MTVIGLRTASPPLLRRSNVKQMKLRRKNALVTFHSNCSHSFTQFIKEYRRERHERLVFVNAKERNEDHDVIVPDDFVEAKIESVSHRDNCGVLALRLQDERESIVQMYIGEFECSQLIQWIDNNETKRPMSYDLMKNSLKMLGYYVSQVRVTELVGHTYHARIYYQMRKSDDESFSVDARPSDAVNLAVRFNAPLFVHRNVARRMGTPSHSVKQQTQLDVVKLCREEIHLHEDPTVVLKLQLQMAIAQEHYSEAAKLRDQIDKLLASHRVLGLIVAIESAISGGRFEEALQMRDTLRSLRLTQGGSEKHKSY